MQRLLSRHFGLVKFLGVGLVVFFAGSALTTHVVSTILMDVEGAAARSGDDGDDDEAGEDEADPDGDPDGGQPQVLASARPNALAGMASKATRKRDSAEAITTANIFCPSCVAVDEPAPVLADGGMIAVGETASSLPLQLLATMESDDPTWSMATIRDLDSNSLAPYTANEQIRPGVTVLSVERGRVVLLNAGRREFISLGAEPPPPAAAPKASAPKPPQAKPGKSVAIEGADQAIDCSSEHSCTIERKFVDKLLADPRQLMTQARMFPVTKDGETAGFRVSGVKSGSLATMIGLENGDVVSEINGQKLGNLDDAMGMYHKLRRANHLSVVVERGGAVVTKEISIK